MNRKLYIIGAGGLGKELGAYIKYINSDFLLKGFFDDSKSGKVGDLESIEGPLSELGSIEKDSNLVIGIGNPILKKTVFEQIPNKENFRFPNFKQQNVYIADTQALLYGKGTIICANSSLTTDITIGQFVLINLNCSIGHDVKIGDFSSIMPGVTIGGNVSIGEQVMIGAGGTILPGVSIGDQATIGAGAVVTKDIAGGATVKGVPAV